MEVDIREWGHLGDGIAEWEGQKIFVSGGVPGDRLRVETLGKRATIIEILTASDMRRDPLCPHFESCGGCSLQHVNRVIEDDFKRARLLSALAQFDVDVEHFGETLTVPDGSRRRGTFTLWNDNGDVRYGFREKRSHRPVAIDTCLLLEPQIMDAIVVLAKKMGKFLLVGKSMQLQITNYANGLDIDLKGSSLDLHELNFQDIEALSDLMATSRVARLSIDGEVYLQNEAPQITFADVNVYPPQGAFLQSSSSSEAALQSIVLKALKGRGKAGRRVADLFCGCGTFSFPLSTEFEVEAFDSDEHLVAALLKAAQVSVKKRLHAEKRDLFRRPLAEKELNKFGAVVLNPARSGAKDQVERIAASSLGLVVYVSCDPGTFARDCKILAGSGFKLKELTPVDQFKYSAHLECVGVLERE